MNELQVLLSEAEKVAKNIYNSALTFLVIGLLVAGAGVAYFYFSNDAVFLEKSFYEDQIAKLEAERDKSISENILLVAAFNKQLKEIKMNDTLSTNLSRIANREHNANVDLFNSISAYVNSDGEGKATRLFNQAFAKADKDIDKLAADIKVFNKASAKKIAVSKEIGTLLDKYESALASPQKIGRVASAYDRPELVLSPKLVYGFFSRLGGLIFIELIAFYFLKQYRINMIDFKYYDSIVRQARLNLYMIEMASTVVDEKAKFEYLNKLFANGNSASIAAEAAEGPIDSSHIDVLDKLLTAAKDILKR